MCHLSHDVSFICVAYVYASFKCATWLIHMCDMTHSYVRYDTFHIHVSDSRSRQECYIYQWATSHVWRSHIAYVCDVTHPYLRDDPIMWETHHHDRNVTCINESRHTCEGVMSHLCATWLIHMCDMTQLRERLTLTIGTFTYINESHVWMSHVTRMSASCHTYERAMSHTWETHAHHRNVTYINESRHTYEWVTSRVWMSHVTHTNETCHTHECIMSHVWMRHVTHVRDPSLTNLTEIWGISHRDPRHICINDIKYRWDTWHII